MTKLSKDLDREIDGYIVRISPQGLLIREKGRRKWFGPLPYGHLFIQAVRAEVHLPGPSKPRTQGRAVSRGLLSISR